MTETQFATGLAEIFLSLWRNRSLAFQMVVRDVVGRYRGSLAGLLWSLFNPVLMLLVYTFVFSVVLKMRWGGASGGRLDFAVMVFSGMIVHSLFSECINRAPTIVLGSPNLVKKVIFPLEVLPWVTLGSALFHTLVNFAVLLVFVFIAQQSISWTALLFPLVLAPFALFTLGTCWILASVGVYLRDIGQVTGLLTMVLLFLSPVFFPLSALPPLYQKLFQLNPLSFVIEQGREVLVWGRLPAWSEFGLYALFALLFAWLGLWWFQRTRRGFADVI
jgi:lipopolysaccharide transport system permease protein